MWLVLCDESDPAGSWAWEGLRSRLPGPVELVTARQLGDAVRWEHRLGAPIEARVTLADGRTIDSAEVTGTLNRLLVLPFQRAARAIASDRDYAAQELLALAMSWLAALPAPVLNPATALGLGGPLLTPSAWLKAGLDSGLDVVPLRVTSGGEEPVAPRAELLIYVVQGAVIGPADAPPAIIDGCLRLAARAGCPLLALGFSAAPTTWSFAGASPWFDLRLGGDALLGALARALEAKR